MEPIRCAIVGLGMIGREHFRILHAHAAVDVAVVCDTDAGAADHVPDGIRFVADLDAALDTPGLEAVWICTPQEVHLAPVEAALARGLHVFCEKPMAATLADAVAMHVAAGAAGDRLVIGHTLRFDPDYIAVQEAVASGRLGTVVQMAARWNAPDFEGRIISGRTSVPLEMSIHDLDVMRWIAGDIESVYAEACRFGVVGPGPDAVVGVVRFASGAIGALEHNWIMRAEAGIRSDHRLAVFGSAGSAYVESRETPAAIFAAETQYVNTKYYSYPHGIPYGALPTEDAYFLARVRDGRPWPFALEDARAALVAALAMDRSIATGEPVAVADIDRGDAA